MNHAQFVLIEFVLRDRTIVVPEVRKKFEACDVAKSKVLVMESSNVDRMNGVNQLVAKSTVDVVINAKNGAVLLVLTVGFGDLRIRSIVLMDRCRSWVCWSYKRNVVLGK